MGRSRNRGCVSTRQRDTQIVETGRCGLDERAQNAGDGVFGARLTHRFPESGQVDRRTGRGCGAVVSLGSPALDDGKQLMRLEGLRQIVVHAGREATVFLDAGSMGREGDDSLLRPAGRGANHFGGGEPVHFGHLDIHQDDVERLARNGRNRLSAVADDLDDVPALLEHHAGDFLVYRIVLRNQDAELAMRFFYRIARDDGPCLSRLSPEHDGGHGFEEIDP